MLASVLANGQRGAGEASMRGSGSIKADREWPLASVPAECFLAEFELELFRCFMPIKRRLKNKSRQPRVAGSTCPLLDQRTVLYICGKTGVRGIQSQAEGGQWALAHTGGGDDER